MNVPVRSNLKEIFGFTFNVSIKFFCKNIPPCKYAVAFMRASPTVLGVNWKSNTSLNLQCDQQQRLKPRYQYKRQWKNVVNNHAFQPNFYESKKAVKYWIAGDFFLTLFASCYLNFYFISKPGFKKEGYFRWKRNPALHKPI